MLRPHLWLNALFIAIIGNTDAWSMAIAKILHETASKM